MFKKISSTGSSSQQLRTSVRSSPLDIRAKILRRSAFEPNSSCSMYLTIQIGIRREGHPYRSQHSWLPRGKNIQSQGSSSCLSASRLRKSLLQLLSAVSTAHELSKHHSLSTTQPYRNLEAHPSQLRLLQHQTVRVVRFSQLRLLGYDLVPGRGDKDSPRNLALEILLEYLMENRFDQLVKVRMLADRLFQTNCARLALDKRDSQKWSQNLSTEDTQKSLVRRLRNFCFMGTQTS